MLDLSEFPSEQFADSWGAVKPAIEAKVLAEEQVYMQLPEVCPHRTRILLKFVERQDPLMFYTSDVHGIGVVFMAAEEQGPEMLVSVHAQLHHGDIHIVGCSPTTGNKIVEWIHSGDEDLTMKGLIATCKRRLPGITKGTRIRILASATGKMLSEIHGRLYFPKGRAHSLKPTRRLRSKTWLGDSVMRAVFLPLA